MKSRLLVLIGAATLLLLSSNQCGNDQAILQADWLIGTWVNNTARGNVYERWQQINKQELSGRSYVMKEGLEVDLEHITLILEKGQVYYVPVVTNQNDGLPVRFKATSITNDQMVFENPEHDFPQRISYRKITRDSLLAEISGMQNGVQKKVSFPMKRIE